MDLVIKYAVWLKTGVVLYEFDDFSEGQKELENYRKKSFY